MFRYRWLAAARSLVGDAMGVYLTLLKILVPTLLVVKGLEMAGAVSWIGAALSPLMGLLGLPDGLGVVWAATLLTNIFAGLVVFFEIAGDMSLSVAQVTVLGALMLVGHSLPVEGAVARRAGVPWPVTLVLRIGGALLLGVLLHHTYTAADLLQEPAEFVWHPGAGSQSPSDWVFAQLQMLGVIFLIILALMVVLKLLRHLGLEKLIHLAISPLLRLLGIGRSAANVTVIGFTLGLSYGAGLLIRDVNQGVLSKRDSFLAVCLLGLCHSVIEDTMLILVLGADLSGVLWARLAFAMVFIAALSRWPTTWWPYSQARMPVKSAQPFNDETSA